MMSQIPGTIDGAGVTLNSVDKVDAETITSNLTLTHHIFHMKRTLETWNGTYENGIFPITYVYYARLLTTKPNQISSSFL